MAKYYKYNSDKNIEGRVLVRNTELFESVNSGAQISEDQFAPLFETGESTKKIGLRPRGFLLVRVDQDTGTIKGRRFVAVVDQTTWENATNDQTYSADGGTWAIRRKIAEEFGT